MEYIKQQYVFVKMSSMEIDDYVDRFGGKYIKAHGGAEIHVNSIAPIMLSKYISYFPGIDFDKTDVIIIKF